MIRYLCNVDLAMDHEKIAQRIVDHWFDDCEHGGVGLFELEPGQMHAAHVDLQPPEWLTRVHVPLQTNYHCTATTPHGAVVMELGKAYTFDTRVEHAVANAGKTKRVHLVFDVKKRK